MEISPALAEARLRALAKAAGAGVLDQVDPGLGTGIVNAHGFFLVEDNPRGLGGALVWAAKHDLERLAILATAGAGDLVRRASLLDLPKLAVEVWHVDGAEVSRVNEAAPAQPVGMSHSDRHMSVSALIVAAGARVVHDNGRLVAEVEGLEVGRVVEDDDGVRLDIGVGQADRELAAFMYNGPVEETLRGVVEVVRGQRTARSHHPLARLARPRWLRSMLLDNPSVVGAADLNPVAGLRPHDTVDNTDPAPALGTGQSGEPLMVVCGAGIDLDLIPEAADLRLSYSPAAELVIVVPERDMGLNSILVDKLQNTTMIGLPPPW